MSIIVGNDVSHYQGQIDFGIYKNNTNFLIAKATQGTSYIDTMYGFNRLSSRNLSIPFGSYHFADGKDATEEAKHFCDVIDGDPIRQGELLMLDYEISLADPVVWCKTWLDYVSNHFKGTKPLIYLNKALVKEFDWTSVVSSGYGLWIADYTYDPNKSSGVFGNWPFAAIQQWTNSQTVPGINGGVDGDVFFGDVEAFKKYGYQEPAPAVEETYWTNQPENPPETPQPVEEPPTTAPEAPQSVPEQETTTDTTTPVEEPQKPASATIIQSIVAAIVNFWLKLWKKK